MSMAEQNQEAIVDAVVFSAWADALEPVAAPPGIRDRLCAHIRASQTAEPLRTVRAAEGWTEFQPGIQIKMLFRDEAGAAKSFLVRLAPGVRLPEHYHATTEECLVLEGEITLGDITVRAGDYHLAPKSAHHGALTTRTGALLFLRTGLDEHVPEAQVR
jgi:quercetin dioxygenase-like cupin family protein